MLTLLMYGEARSNLRNGLHDSLAHHKDEEKIWLVLQILFSMADEFFNLLILCFERIIVFISTTLWLGIETRTVYTRRQ